MMETRLRDCRLGRKGISEGSRPARASPGAAFRSRVPHHAQSHLCSTLSSWRRRDAPGLRWRRATRRAVAPFGGSHRAQCESTDLAILTEGTDDTAEPSDSTRLRTIGLCRALVVCRAVRGRFLLRVLGMGRSRLGRLGRLGLAPRTSPLQLRAGRGECPNRGARAGTYEPPASLDAVAGRHRAQPRASGPRRSRGRRPIPAR
jgi:hypothetical protein